MESSGDNVDNQSLGREVSIVKEAGIDGPGQSSARLEIQVQLRERLDGIVKSKDIQELAVLIKEYCRMVSGRREEELFVSYFVENKFLEILKQKLQQLNFEPSLFGAVFAQFEVLLQSVRNPDNLIYFLVTINQLGYLSGKYDLIEEYGPYYTNFLKLLCFTIKQNEIREPHFPLILNLLKLSTCSELIMQTKVKLGIIQIARSSNPEIKRYIINFPFVVFYPRMMNQMKASLERALGDDEKTSRMEGQNLVNQLLYMREFMVEKDEMLVDMFSNTFLQIIGKRIYGEMNNYGDHYAERIKKMFRFIVEKVVPQIDLIDEQIRHSIPQIQGDKIKTGLSMLISPFTTPSLMKCFEGEVVEMDEEYWLMDECQQDVVDHCRRIFYNDVQDNDSIMKVMGSYLPWSKDNWLYYEMKKISECIGMKVNLNEPLTHDSIYLPGSFLTALGRLSDQEHMPNPLFEKILKEKDEELLYWYIRLTNSLFYRQKKDLSFFSFDLIVRQLLNCNSLALVQSFYLLLLQEPFHAEQLDLQAAYSQVTERLIHYVITKGWGEFSIKIRQSRLQQNDKDFYQDAYREIQCDILLFVVIKTLFGSFNDQGSDFKREEWNIKSDKTSEITLYCQNQNRQEELLLFILDGQYLCVKNEKNQRVHQEELLIRNLQFYEDRDGVVRVVGRESDSWGATLCFSNEIIAHILQEIASRKRLAMRIELQLKNMKFEFVY